MGNCIASQPPHNSLVEDLVSSLNTAPSITFGSTPRRLLDDERPRQMYVDVDGMIANNNNNSSATVPSNRPTYHHRDNPPGLPTFSALAHRLEDGEVSPISGELANVGSRVHPVAHNPLALRSARHQVFGDGDVGELRRMDSNSGKLNSHHSSSSASADRSAKEMDPLGGDFFSATAESVMACDGTRDAMSNRERKSQLTNSMSVSDHNEGQGMMNESCAKLNAATTISRVNSSSSVGNQGRRDAAGQRPPLVTDSNIADADGADETTTTATTTTTASSATQVSSMSTVSSVTAPWGNNSLTRILVARPPPIVICTPAPTPAIPIGHEVVPRATAPHQPRAPEPIWEVPPVVPSVPAANRRALGAAVVTIREPTPPSARPTPTVATSAMLSQGADATIGSTLVPRPPHANASPAATAVRAPHPPPKRAHHTVSTAWTSQQWVQHQQQHQEADAPAGPTPFEAASEYLLFAGDVELQSKENMWEERVHASIAGKCWIISQYGWK
jgi:hypothetical protein